MDKLVVTQEDREALANLKERAALLRREGTYTKVWFADQLLKAADDLDELHARLSPAPEGVDAREYARGIEDAAAYIEAQAKSAQDTYDLISVQSSLRITEPVFSVAGLQQMATAIRTLSRPPAEQVRMREAIINTPETADFMAGVPLEAAHQRERWGSDHDSGKTAEDWIFLVGWLLGKASQALKAGDIEKAKHHTISSAAACANWHASLSGADSRMRPGIDPVDRALTPPPKGQNDGT